MSGILTIEAGERRGNVHVTIPEKEAAPFVSFAKSIPNSHIYKPETTGMVKGFGRELEPHVTALFGLVGEGDSAEAVAKAVKTFEGDAVSLTLGNLSLFTTNPDYDVLKVDVKSPHLHALNEAISKLPNENDHPDYHPHLTIAYLKKGMGEKYDGDDRFSGKKISISELTHSDADRNQTVIPLTASEPIHAADMIYQEPVEFEAAMQANAVKRILPTTLDTKQLGKKIHQVAFTSARVNEGKTLEFIHGRLQQQLAGRGNEAETRVAIGQYLEKTGYQAPAGKEGQIQDLSTEARQNLIIRTNLATARGYGQFVEQNDSRTLDAYPALELVRYGSRMHPRGDPSYSETSDGSIGWEDRWPKAIDDCDDDESDKEAMRDAFDKSGRMVALKSSDVWDSLGNLWEDSLGNSYPPFAFLSGMDTEEVDRADAEDLGLIDPDDKPEAADMPEFADGFEMAADIGDELILSLVSKAVRGLATIVGGVLGLTASEPIYSGDTPGHEFHGNQWTGALGSGHHVTDSPAFKKWFGKSKAVDKDGNPLVVYKGMPAVDWETGKPFDSIDRKSEFPAFNHGEQGTKIAGFFSSKSDVANRFAAGYARPGEGSSAVFPCYLSIQHPYVIDAKGKAAGIIEFEESGRPFREAIRSGKFDGVIIKNTKDEGDVYVALRPSQIKSAIGNRGTFDPKKADITASETDTLISAKLILRNVDGEVLLLKDARSDYWDLPGGHIHAGEAVEDGLRREVKEETGLDVGPVLSMRQETLQFGAIPTLVFFYTADSPKTDVTLSEEHTAFEWVPTDKLSEKDTGAFAGVLAASVKAAEWEESEHPREPAGSPGGGEFASSDAGLAYDKAIQESSAASMVIRDKMRQLGWSGMHQQGWHEIAKEKFPADYAKYESTEAEKQKQIAALESARALASKEANANAVQKLRSTPWEKRPENFEILSKNTNTAHGSRYYDVAYKGEWYKVRIADHEQHTEQSDILKGDSLDKQFLARTSAASSGMAQPHRIDLIVSKPLTSEKESRPIIISELRKRGQIAQEKIGEDWYGGRDTIHVGTQ